jgi:hypothetical protein
MVAATARQRWLAGIEIRLGFDEVFGWVGSFGLYGKSRRKSPSAF